MFDWLLLIVRNDTCTFSSIYRFWDCNSWCIRERTSWRTSQIRGCWFHLIQSRWREIQNLGLSEIYKYTSSENEIGAFLKLFCEIPFLSSKEVIKCFTDDLVAFRSTDDTIIVWFMDCIFYNYISPETSFPQSIWAQYFSTINRTTNKCVKLTIVFEKGTQIFTNL